MRDFIVKRIDAPEEPIIDKGEAPFFVDDKELVPKGYVINAVHNRPNLKTIYVTEAEAV